MPLNSTMIAVAVPEIAADLGRDPDGVTQALVATYLVAAIALQSPGGRLGDRLGHWRVLALGQAVLAGGAVLGYLAPTLWLLTVSRALMAAGGAVVVPAVVALIRLELPAERRGRAYGWFGAGMSLAAGVGPLLGGELVRLFGWEAIFLMNLPVLAVSVLVAAGTGSAPAAAPAGPGSSRFDWLGSGLLTAALTALVVGSQAASASAIVPLLALGVLLCVPFVWWERRAGDPVVDFGLFRAAPFTAGTLLVALLNLVLYALLFEIPLVLHAIFNLDAEHVGRLWVFMMASMIGTSVLAGRLTDRYGARIVALAGTLVGLAGIILLLTSSLDSPGSIRVPLVLLGVALGLANPAAQTASLSSVSRRQSGMAAGVGSTMRYLGGIVGVATLGRVVDTSGTASSVIAEHHVLMVTFGAVLLAGLVCVWFLPGGGRESRDVIRIEP
jgi:MFS family permease